MTPAGAIRHLMKHVGLTKARAAADVNWYTSAPTVPMSYLLVREKVVALFAAQHRSLRGFNDWLISHGAVPFAWFSSTRL